VRALAGHGIQVAGKVPVRVVAYPGERRSSSKRRRSYLADRRWFMARGLLCRATAHASGWRCSSNCRRSDHEGGGRARILGTASVLERELRFLKEFRRQIAYHSCLGRPLDFIEKEVRLPSDYYVWMPYDDPRPEDIRHVSWELTAPGAVLRASACGSERAGAGADGRSFS
jgi:hypothetical protein